MCPAPDLDAPTAELLLDVRTPAELAISPNGSRIVFSLHATVADVGIVLAERPVRGGGRRRDAAHSAHGRCVERQAPAWSPDGSRLAWLSDRITPGHQLTYTMLADGGEPALAAELAGSAESAAWSSDAGRLLVLAADPGSYGLDWSARAVNGAGPASDPLVRRPGDARRRLFLIDLASGDVAEVGPPDLSVWEVDWDGDGTVVAIVSRDHSGSGWYQAVVARLDLEARTAQALYEPSWQVEGLALAPDGSSSGGGRGIRERSRSALGQRHARRPRRPVRRPTHGRTCRTVGRAAWCDDGSLWYARTDGNGKCVRPNLAGRATRGTMARRRLHR